MVKPIIKKSEDLSSDEIKELNEICRSINSYFPKDHIQVNHINKTSPIFYLFKVQEKIVAFHAFSIFKEKTPFGTKELPIIYINLSFKKPNADAHIKNYAKWSNAHFLKANIGRFWLFKKFVLIFLTNNPKVAKRSANVFHQSYPVHKTDTPQKIQDFAKQFIHKNLKLTDSNINQNLVLSKENTYKMDIDSKWENLYKSCDSEQNKFFIKNDIIHTEDNKFFLTGNLILFMGCSSFLNLIKNILHHKLKKNQSPYKTKR
jgi:hypothetical protein